MLGEPLSATEMVNRLLVPPNPAGGVQENAPLLAFTVALLAPVSKLKVNVGVGTFVSVALAVKATVWPKFTV